MHKNKIWLAFLGIMTLAVLWFSVGAVNLLFAYSQVTGQTPATVSEWKAQKLSDDEYYLQAHYSYEVENETYQGDWNYTNPLYINELAANKAIEERQEESFVAWYNPEYPKQSQLERFFPYKQLFSATILWALLFYFYWLGYYVGNKQQ